MFWGGSFLAIRFSIGTFPPFVAASLRVAIATVLVLLYMLARGERVGRNLSVIWQLVAIGFFTLGFPWALLFWGEQFVSPAMSSILNSTVPLFTVVITALAFKNEAINRSKGLGVMVGFFGVLCIFAPTILRGGNNDLAGMTAILGMAICYAIGIVWLKSVSHLVSTSVAFFLQGAGALLFLVPLSLAAERDVLAAVQWSSASGWAAVTYLGVFSTAIAQLIFFVLVREWGSVRASAITYVTPVVAVILDWIVFGTFLKINAIIGAAIVLVGVHLVHRSPAYKPDRISEVEPA
jgi:drug/metabolite transporter (DMT)-like permease